MAEWSDRIFHANRLRRENGPRHEAVPLKPLQSVSESLVRNPMETPLDLIEARGLWTDHYEYQDRPFVRDLVEHRANPRHLAKGAMRKSFQVSILVHI